MDARRRPQVRRLTRQPFMSEGAPPSHPIWILCAVPHRLHLGSLPKLRYAFIRHETHVSLPSCFLAALPARRCCKCGCSSCTGISGNRLFRLPSAVCRGTCGWRLGAKMMIQLPAFANLAIAIAISNNRLPGVKRAGFQRIAQASA